MIPYTYEMVDMGGVDLADIIGNTYSGLYSKILDSLDDRLVVVLYNWRCADIKIPPSYVNISVFTHKVVINGLVEVNDDDTITIPNAQESPVILSLEVVENGTYAAPSDVDGYSPITVEVPQPSPVVNPLSVTENGTYSAPSGVDGYSPVSVNVPQTPPLVTTLYANANGTYEPPTGVDGYNPVIVNVVIPPPVIQSLSVTENGTYTATGGVNGYSPITVNVPSTQAGSYDPTYDSSVVSSIEGKIITIGPYAAFQGRVNFASSLNLNNRKIFTIPSAIAPSGYFEFSGLGNGGSTTNVKGHINPEDGGFYIDTSITTNYIYVEAQWFYGTPVSITPIASGISITGAVTVSGDTADMHLKVVLSGSNSWVDLFSLPQSISQDSEVPFIVALSGNNPVKDAMVSSGVISAWLPSGTNTLLIHKTWKFN